MGFKWKKYTEYWGYDYKDALMHLRNAFSNFGTRGNLKGDREALVFLIEIMKHMNTRMQSIEEQNYKLRQQLNLIREENANARLIRNGRVVEEREE